MVPGGGRSEALLDACGRFPAAASGGPGGSHGRPAEPTLGGAT